LTATLDERTAQLAEAQARTEALAGSVASAESRAAELGHSKQHIAALKTSRPWRLMAPLHAIYRPVRRFEASRLGIKLRAAWRHPSNSSSGSVSVERACAL
jgi:hypothetical protein